MILFKIFIFHFFRRKRKRRDPHFKDDRPTDYNLPNIPHPNLPSNQTSPNNGLGNLSDPNHPSNKMIKLEPGLQQNPTGLGANINGNAAAVSVAVTAQQQAQAAATAAANNFSSTASTALAAAAANAQAQVTALNNPINDSYNTMLAQQQQLMVAQQQAQLVAQSQAGMFGGPGGQGQGMM